MGKAIGIFVLLAAITGSWPAWCAPETPAMMGEVLAALDKGDAVGAARVADLALRDEDVTASQRGSLLLYRGLARELLGAPGDALRDFTQALDGHALQSDEQEQALLQRGFLRDGLGHLEEAASDYTAAIALRGDSLAVALNNRANVYRRQNKLRQARMDYLAALSLNNDRQQYSYYGLGQIAEAGKDISAARGFYAKAVSADPGYALASERLQALGGIPDGTIPGPGDKIILRPPQEQAQMPAQAPDPKPVSLRKARDLGKASRQRPAPAEGRNSASPPMTTPNATILRPALDQTGAAGANVTEAQVQLGAWRSTAEAELGWTRAQARAGGVLDGLSPHILPADLPGKGRYYRLRVSAKTDQGGRAGLCASLVAKGLACLPVQD